MPNHFKEKEYEEDEKDQYKTGSNPKEIIDEIVAEGFLTTFQRLTRSKKQLHKRLRSAKMQWIIKLQP